MEAHNTLSTILDDVSILELVCLIAVESGEMTMDDAELVAHCSGEIMIRHKDEIIVALKGLLEQEKKLNLMLQKAIKHKK